MATKTYTPLSNTQRIQKILSQPGVSAKRETALTNIYNKQTGNKGLVPRLNQTLRSNQVGPLPFSGRQAISVKPNAPMLVDYGPRGKTAPVRNVTPEQQAEHQKYLSDLSNGMIVKQKDPNYNQPLVNTDNYRSMGLFYNKGGNYFTDSKGKKIDPMTGKPYATPQEEAVSSYEDIGKGLIQSEFDQAAADAKELGIEDTYSSLEEQFNDIIQNNREQDALKEAQIQEQQDALNYSTGVQKNSAESQMDTLAGALASNREGFGSGSNSSVSDRLKAATDLRIKRLLKSKDVANMALEQAKKDLKFAERTGNTEMAKKYRSIIDAATAKAQQIDTDYINALTNQSQEERAKQTALETSFSNFTAMVDKGTELTTEGISDIAKQLGVPFEVANAYYTGAQAIRDNNKLTLEEKQAQIDQKKQDLLDQVDRVQTAAATNIEYLKKMYADGVDPELIAAFKQTAGITDYDDPLTSAKLRIDEANAKIKEAEANGTPAYGTEAYWKLQQARLDAEKAQADYDSVYNNVSTGTLNTGNRRVDANNNPTAFTTDVAKSFGLVEGVDYVQGDKFPGDSNLYTAKLLGDPIGITIKGIDYGGFTTQGGKNRWSYTSKIPNANNAAWAKLSYEQKVEVIRQMNKYEGGNGNLTFVAPDTDTTKSTPSSSPSTKSSSSSSSSSSDDDIVW